MVDEKRKKELIKNNEKKYFNSGLSFIYKHNGFRPGNIHLIVGVTSGGKSTLTRSLIWDYLAFNDQHIMLWLSEESEEDFVCEFSRVKLPEGKTLDPIDIKSEVNLYQSGIKPTVDYFEEQIRKQPPKVLFLDNLTTSIFYMSKKPSEQDEVSWKIKTLANELNIAVIILAHTSSGINLNHTKVISVEDIRGSRTIANIAQFAYVMQTFNIHDSILQYVRIVKHRGQEVDNKNYLLSYSKMNRIYYRSDAQSFSDFKDSFSKRDKL